MSAFDLFPAEAAAKMERGAPIDLNEQPGFFAGAGSAAFKGVAKGLVVEPARTLNLGLSFAPDMVDRAFGTSTRDWWFDNMMLKNVSRRVTPDPRETGLAGQMLHSLFDVGSQALTVGPAGVGVLKTVGRSIEGVEEGLDPLTAMKKGGIEGATTALGVALPITMPPIVGSKIPSLVQQLGYGVATNVPIGIGQRALTHQVLADAGYKEMAEQYKALDETGLMSDVVLGAFFGGLGHAITAKGAKLPLIRPSDVDFALAKKNAYHVEVDSAPGLAKNAETRDAHVDSHLKATEDLINGRPVDVSETLRATDFEPNPAVDAARQQILDTQREIGKAYDEVRERPLGPADDPLIRMTAGDIEQVLLERGPTALKKDGSMDIKPGRYGIVKIIWRHGEKSSKEPGAQVTRDDVIRTAEVLADYKPALDETDDRGRRMLDWHVQRADGKSVIYSVHQFIEDGTHHVVTVFVNQGKTEKAKEMPLSPRREPESPSGPGKGPAGDTASGASALTAPKGQEGASVPKITEALKAEGLEASDENVSIVDQVARALAIDAAAVDALPDRMPDGEYMAKIKEIINADAKAKGAGAGGEKPAGEGPGAARGNEPGEAGPGGGEAAGRPAREAQPGGEGTRAIDEAQMRGAIEVVAKTPDLKVTLEDGTTVTAKEALDRADADIAKAETDAKAFEAAVLCATRRGG